MSWQDLKDFENDYEIWTEFPYQIRKKSNQRIVKESVHKENGYIICYLNSKQYKKHRIIANNFIENPNKFEYVDHVNHDRTDYRIENLRWCSNRMNCNNKSYQTFVDEIPEDNILVEEYSDWRFEFLYFVPETDTFYLFNGINYVVKPRFLDKARNWNISIRDINNKQRRIQYRKFKKQYGLI